MNLPYTLLLVYAAHTVYISKTPTGSFWSYALLSADANLQCYRNTAGENPIVVFCFTDMVSAPHTKPTASTQQTKFPVKYWKKLSN